MALIPALQRQREVDLYKYEANLFYLPKIASVESDFLRFRSVEEEEEKKEEQEGGEEEEGKEGKKRRRRRADMIEDAR